MQDQVKCLCVYTLYVVYITGGVKGFDWGPYLAQTGSEGAAVSCFRHVCLYNLVLANKKNLLCS